MDGVLADVYKVFFELHEQETGERLTLKDVAGLLEGEAFKNEHKWVSKAGFFRNLPVIPGSREALIRLNDHYKVIVVSLATEFPYCLTDKRLWLHDNFPFISWRQMMFCGDKNIIKADIMIDDHFKNLDYFEGRTILFTQPHNMLIANSKHLRVNSWAEIEKLLI
jgi:5'-nucleotidase